MLIYNNTHTFKTVRVFTPWTTEVYIKDIGFKRQTLLI